MLPRSLRRPSRAGAQARFTTHSLWRTIMSNLKIELTHEEQARVNHVAALEAKRRSGAFVSDHELNEAKPLAAWARTNAEARAATSGTAGGSSCESSMGEG